MRLRGILKQPGDRRYFVARQFSCSGYIYAMSEKEARKKVEKWTPEDFENWAGSGHIDALEYR